MNKSVVIHLVGNRFASQYQLHHRGRSMVEHLLMVQWVVRSILHEGPIELFLVPASAPSLV